ncbi:MAG: chromosome partitioning protein ParB family [Rhodocyclaceae bacterium]|nr:MAG: chromosome partitioning protein ParB family [Rhodocyclaceae bacterium]
MTATKAINKKPGLSLGKLSAVAQIAVAKPTQPADAKIELSRIFSVKQVRKTFRNLEELAESFKLNGIIEPLVVHEEPGNEAGIVNYRIIVGERRYRAAPLAGLTEVPVVIKKGLNELEIRRLQVTENNERENLTAYEEAMGHLEPWRGLDQQTHGLSSLGKARLRVAPGRSLQRSGNPHRSRPDLPPSGRPP